MVVFGFCHVVFLSCCVFIVVVFVCFCCFLFCISSFHHFIRELCNPTRTREPNSVILCSRLRDSKSIPTGNQVNAFSSAGIRRALTRQCGKHIKRSHTALNLLSGKLAVTWHLKDLKDIVICNL